MCSSDLIYFVDIRLYGAVTSPKFPVWLQDGKWPPEGKLSSSSISPRGFLFFAVDEVGDLLCPGRKGPAWRAGLVCVSAGAVLCLSTIGRDRAQRRSRAEQLLHFRGPAGDKPKITCLQRFETGRRGRPMGFSGCLIFPCLRRGVAPQ